ncbi:hypothetical protein RCG23_00675 [Neobacillus sp. PS3-34]|uniref:hypothetical protein n=1 Tax=Neobacillus sp. PS3-34 TaxID=3070678 RepID=UPI0027E1CBDD|nr:hypothetical protein [Neobacillus sp. PS3-34]WML48699.1 hypothetical protein RCG23_00675 [Neobacillus sp. PS3-34]
MNFTFDWNEWFFIIASSVIFFLFLFIRKYFNPVIVIIIWIFNITYVSTIDYFLVGTPFKLYIFGDNASYELSGALFHLFMYPCASLLFLYGYDKFELYGKKTIWYILFWNAFSLFFEWVCVKNHALTYTGWKLYYSIPTYPFTAVILIILFRFTKKKLLELSL